jgi:hypothetical protein
LLVGHECRPEDLGIARVGDIQAGQGEVDITSVALGL